MSLHKSGTASIRTDNRSCPSPMPSGHPLPARRRRRRIVRSTAPLSKAFGKVARSDDRGAPALTIILGDAPIAAKHPPRRFLRAQPGVRPSHVRWAHRPGNWSSGQADFDEAAEALTGGAAAPDGDSFFEPVTYVGAMGTTDWSQGFTDYKEDCSPATTSLPSLSVVRIRPTATAPRTRGGA